MNKSVFSFRQISTGLYPDLNLQTLEDSQHYNSDAKKLANRVLQGIRVGYCPPYTIQQYNKETVIGLLDEEAGLGEGDKEIEKDAEDAQEKDALDQLYQFMFVMFGNSSQDNRCT